MYATFYIDQFFVEHFLTGILLLETVSALERQRLSWRRLAAGSLANAGAAAALICLGISGWYVPGFLAAGIITCPGFRVRGKGLKKSIRSLLRHLFIMLVVTVCFGGVLEALLQMVHLPILAGTVPALLLVRQAGACLSRRTRMETGIVNVELTWQDQTLKVRGMIDSGNHLTEPATGRPVSILEEEYAKGLLGENWAERRGFFLIPYHSIGTDKGWLKGVTIDRMTVGSMEDGCIISRPVIAVYAGRVSAGEEYQMILHSMHTQSGIRKQEEYVNDC